VNTTLCGKRDFADIIKDLEVERLSWSSGQAQCNLTDPCKRDVEEQSESDRRQVTVEAVIVVMWPQAVGHASLHTYLDF